MSDLRISTDRLESILFDLSITPTSVSGAEVYALCPGHLRRTGKEDGKPSWSINADSGLHSCWSCGYRGNIVGLIVDQLDLVSNVYGVDLRDYTAAEEWLRGRTRMSVEEMKARLARDQESAYEVRQPVPISEARLIYYDDVPQDALDARVLNPKCVKEYHIKFDTENELWILPIRDPHTNALLGWQEKGHASRHFRNFPDLVEKSHTLFGSWVQGSGDKRVAVVVESPLDAPLITALGGDLIGVSTYGVYVSDTQIELLCSYDEIIFALDDDEVGRKVSRDLAHNKMLKGKHVSFFNYDHVKGHSKDVGEMDDHEILTGINTARSILLGDKVVRDPA